MAASPHVLYFLCDPIFLLFFFFIDSKELALLRKLDIIFVLRLQTAPPPPVPSPSPSFPFILPHAHHLMNNSQKVTQSSQLNLYTLSLIRCVVCEIVSYRYAVFERVGCETVAYRMLAGWQAGRSCKISEKQYT